MDKTLDSEVAAPPDLTSDGQPRFRALLLGFALAAFLGLATPYAEVYLADSRLGTSHLPLGPLALLFLLVAAYNALARRLCPRLAWRRTELLLIYCMLLSTVALAATGYGTWVTQVCAAPFYFANPSNKWRELLFRYLPDWIHPPNQGYVITAFFEGLAKGQTIPWRAWLVPLAAWTLFTALFFGAFACWALILRRRWIESEKLTFPLTRVPLSLVGGGAPPPDKTSVLRSRLFWVGFAVPASFHAFNSLSVYFQGFPQIPISGIAIGSGFTMRPWDVLQDLRLFLIFAVIGVAYLVTAEIALSMWLFFWLHRFQMVLFRALGFGEAQLWWAGTDLVSSQEEGAFFALFFFLLWTARRELLATWRAALSKGWWRRRDPSEPLPFVLAVLGFFAFFGGMVAWLCLAGSRPLGAAILLFIFFVEATILARLVNAGGAIFVEGSWMPQDVALNFFGTRGLAFGSLAAIAMPERDYMYNQETILMPYLMDTLKIGHASRIAGGLLLLGVGGAFLITILCANYMVLTLAYRHGGLALQPSYFSSAPQWPFGRMASNLNNPAGPRLQEILWTGIGAAFMATMILLQYRFLWWPVHPLGFVMSSTNTAHVIWFSFFLGWLAQTLIRRYGGYGPYRRLVPAALGLVLGEYLISAAFLALDVAIGKAGHNIFPPLY